jgi:hypothetical protein
MTNEMDTGAQLVELKEEDLDKVSGGVNPQPLPPGIVAEMTVLFHPPQPCIPPGPSN